MLLTKNTKIEELELETEKTKQIGKHHADLKQRLNELNIQTVES
jgi:hypothetical protein